MLAVNAWGLGTFLLASQPSVSCLPIDPGKARVETSGEPQAPISEPAAFGRKPVGGGLGVTASRESGC